MSNTTSYVEKQIAKYLCGKKIKELNNHWWKMIRMMFPSESEDTVLYCENVTQTLKQDIFIVANAVKKTISIKSGQNATIHCESLDTFCGFLKHLGVSHYGIESLRLYHYGDGSIDGTGDFQDSLDTIREKYRERIADFNAEVNNRAILKQVMNRVLSYGTLNQKDHVDYLYYGNLNDGALYDMNDFIDYLSLFHLPLVRSIHFGTFVYCPFYRLINSKNENLHDRNYIAIKWFRHDIDLDKFYKYSKLKNKNKEHYSCSREIN